eukprot:TRINITY_DN24066_c0_g1_i1.p3 TRINITY_DN24066_c0_g1~~TRINITY_DN24066_c0_g1_i1.p3  ORF type:complete len:111 (-),score=31.63 TRINITY_DN24066_c0_g1_i1:139-471(-)
MKRFIDQVAGQAEGVDVGGDVKKIKSGGDLDASLGQQVNNGSTPFSGGRGGGGGRFRGRGGRYRDRNQGVAPSPTGMSLGMNALTNGVGLVGGVDDIETATKVQLQVQRV